MIKHLFYKSQFAHNGILKRRDFKSVLAAPQLQQLPVTRNNQA